MAKRINLRVEQRLFFTKHDSYAKNWHWGCLIHRRSIWWLLLLQVVKRPLPTLA
jgi:hypothetical protein